ncbi:MAG: hypothetical protein K0R50_919 [Eubacterium sp.]|jgi:hypothetical protein|nr:hypothetical protein [Eubacterium sp.]
MKEIKAYFSVKKVNNLVIIFIVAIGVITGCSNKQMVNVAEVVNHEKQSLTTSVEEVSHNEEAQNINQFFCYDISSNKQYLYRGSLWNQDMYDAEGSKYAEYNKYLDSEGRLRVMANLAVSKVAKLTKGNIYELKFSITGAKNNTEEKDEKIYLWITKDKIYQFCPPNDFDYKGFVENGIVNELGCIKEMEKSGQLPSTERSLIRCINTNMKFKEDVWETEISVTNNQCTYCAYNSRNSSYSKFVWETGKGLVCYSWGYGARKEGLDLKLVE